MERNTFWNEWKFILEYVGRKHAKKGIVWAGDESHVIKLKGNRRPYAVVFLLFRVVFTYTALRVMRVLNFM